MQYNTKQREVLMKFLIENRDKTYSAEEIVKALEGVNIGASSVYRNLAALEKEGRLRKVLKSGERKALYQYIDSSRCTGHLHLYCTKCGSTSHLDYVDSMYITQSVKRNAKFDIDQENTMIYGICKKCKKNEQ